MKLYMTVFSMSALIVLVVGCGKNSDPNPPEKKNMPAEVMQGSADRAYTCDLFRTTTDGSFGQVSSFPVYHIGDTVTEKYSLQVNSDGRFIIGDDTTFKANENKKLGSSYQNTIGVHEAVVRIIDSGSALIECREI